tara:strand:+ start:1050 stop:1550 length:501 start_codon:yes stop_codon:yes gene_type:complete
MTSVDIVLTTWDDSAAYIAKDIFGASGSAPARKWPPMPTTERIRVHLDIMIDKYFNSSDAVPTRIDWTTMARLSIKASGCLDEVETVETLCSKQRDYGPNNIARFGHSGLLLRLHDKVARLENLLAQGRDAQNESLHDTYLDIVGYSVIGVMLLDGSFFFPLASFA